MSAFIFHHACDLFGLHPFTDESVDRFCRFRIVLCRDHKDRTIGTILLPSRLRWHIAKVIKAGRYQCDHRSLRMIGSIKQGKAAAVRCPDDSDPCRFDILLLGKKVESRADIAEHCLDSGVCSFRCDRLTVRCFYRLSKATAIDRQYIEPFCLHPPRKIVVRMPVALPLMKQ